MSRTKPKRLRRTFTEQEKLSILQEAAETSIPAVAEKYSINTALLFDWRKRERLKNSPMPNLQVLPSAPSNLSSDLPSLQREYEKLAKIQASLSNKLHREIQRGEITAYAAGCTLANLYNGISKLESLRGQLATESQPDDQPKLQDEAMVVSPELQRDAEKLLSMFMQDKQEND